MAAEFNRLGFYHVPVGSFDREAVLALFAEFGFVLAFAVGVSFNTPTNV